MDFLAFNVEPIYRFLDHMIVGYISWALIAFSATMYVQKFGNILPRNSDTQVEPEEELFPDIETEESAAEPEYDHATALQKYGEAID